MKAYLDSSPHVTVLYINTQMLSDYKMHYVFWGFQRLVEQLQLIHEDLH